MGPRAIRSRAWREEFFPEIERHTDQPDQHRHFNERTDDGREGLPRLQAEDGDGYGDGQLKVVAGGGE